MKISRDKYLNKIKKSLSLEKITFLIGARRVGKTTLIKALIRELEDQTSFYYSFDDLLSLPKFQSTQHFLDYLAVKYGTKIDNLEYLFLDEVQNIPNIEIILKDLVDNHRKFKILASSSGSFEIFHNIQESLLGRKEIIYVYPVSFAEYLAYKGENLAVWQNHWYAQIYQDKKSLIEEFLRFGGYPSVICAQNETDKFHELKNIVDTWLDTDIRLILSKEDFLNFKPILELLAHNTASLVVISKIAQKLHLHHTKIKKFLYIMQKSFLVDFISPYSQRRTDEIKAHQKAYFIDTGILNYLNQNFNLQDSNKGKIIENFVFTEIIKNKAEHHEIKFWRNKNGSEIDFIIYNLLKNSLLPIEVKAKSTNSLPKIFYSLTDSYTAQIEKFVLLNQDLLETKNIATQLHKQTVEIQPFFLPLETIQ